MPSSQPKILVVGDAMLDVAIRGSCHRVAPEAPVPVLLTDGLDRYMPGGAGNVAANASSLGGQVRLVCAIGDDSTGHRLSCRLTEYGVTCCTSITSAPTTTKTRLFDGQHLLARYDHEGRLKVQESDELLRKAAVELERNPPDVLVLSDYNKGLFDHEPRTRALIDLARSGDVPVLVDAKRPDIQRFSGCTLLTPNLPELRALVNLTDSGSSLETDPSTLADAAAIVCRQYQCDLLVTRGARGVLHVALADAHVCVHTQLRGLMTETRRPDYLEVPAYHPRHVYDVTGAGDTLLAALALRWPCRDSLRDKLAWAVRAAAAAVAQPGTAVVHPDDLEDIHSATGRGPVVYLRDDGPIRLLSWFKEGGQPQRLVMTTGCFDLLHLGHMNFLAQSANLGDFLLVAVNSDESVRRLKGDGRPIVPWRDRACQISHLPFKGAVIRLNQDDPSDLVSTFKPQIFVKGSQYRDQKVTGTDLLHTWGGKLEFIPMSEGISTTDLVRRVIGESVV